MNVKKEFDEKFLQFCRQIMEHDTSFISIRCLVTRKDGDNSYGWDVGTGCYYSFLGRARELMIMDDERTRLEIARREDLDREPED